MEKYLESLKDCHAKIKIGYKSSKQMPTLEEQRELLLIAQTCLNLSKRLTEIRKIASMKENE